MRRRAHVLSMQAVTARAGGEFDRRADGFEKHIKSDHNMCALPWSQLLARQYRVIWKSPCDVDEVFRRVHCVPVYISRWEAGPRARL